MNVDKHYHLMKKNNLIGISGREKSGKDLLGHIIQYLVANGMGSNINPTAENYVRWYEDLNNSSDWIIKKYADKLKEIICLLLGCSRKDLEDREFKEKILGPEWWYWKENITGNIIKPYAGPEVNDYILVKPSPRTLMLLIGTECGRQMIHPNLWVISLFSDYKPRHKGRALSIENGPILEAYMHTKCENCSKAYYGYKRQYLCKECIENDDVQFFPNWIITDVRFPQNEGGAIKERGGINIGIKRKFSIRYPEYATLEDPDSPYSIPVELSVINSELYNKLTHDSEELMGEFEWCDYVIVNDGTIDELIQEMEKILIKENIIKNNAINIS